jgi:hypothetical protein
VPGLEILVRLLFRSRTCRDQAEPGRQPNDGGRKKANQDLLCTKHKPMDMWSLVRDGGLNAASTDLPVGRR